MKPGMPQPWQIWWANLRFPESMQVHMVLVVSPISPLRESEVLLVSGDRIPEKDRGRVKENRVAQNVRIVPADMQPTQPRSHHGRWDTGEEWNPPNHAGIQYEHTINGKEIRYARLENFRTHVCTIQPEFRRRILDSLKTGCEENGSDSRRVFQILKNYIGRLQRPAKTQKKHTDERPKEKGAPQRRMTRAEWEARQRTERENP